jgi:RHS repeat-associated protein
VVDERRLRGSATNPLGFQGQYLDSASGLYDMRARDYDAATSRFTSPDPQPGGAGTAFAQSYAFAFNDPTSLTDPSGACLNCATALLGALIGAVAGGVGNYITCDHLHKDCAAQIWTGIGIGAAAGGLAGFTFGGSVVAGLLADAALGALLSLSLRVRPRRL